MHYDLMVAKGAGNVLDASRHACDLLLETELINKQSGYKFLTSESKGHLSKLLYLFLLNCQQFGFCFVFYLIHGNLLSTSLRYNLCIISYVLKYTLYVQFILTTHLKCIKA